MNVNDLKSLKSSLGKSIPLQGNGNFKKIFLDQAVGNFLKVMKAMNKNLTKIRSFKMYSAQEFLKPV